MQIVLIIGLIVSVASLIWMLNQQNKTLEKYEKDLMKKYKKGK